MSETYNERIDEILEDYREVIGSDFPGYRNHCIRMAEICDLLQATDEEDRHKIAIAAAFHDIGLWMANTLDYLPPSVTPAVQYLEKQGLEDWSDEVSAMILEHHKLRPVDSASSYLVELFRKADLVDFSRGLVRFGLSRAKYSQLVEAYPNAGFHKMLVRISCRWFVRHPLNPLPMMKW